MQRSSSKSSQTDLPAESSAVLNDIVEETFEQATRSGATASDATVPAKDLESDKICTGVESRSNSPGVDPRKAMPISPEDAANLKEPLIQGLGSHDEHHKALTAHLPPQEVQEAHLREVREAERARRQKEGRDHLSIHLPPRDGARNTEAMSSPGSTVDAQSATTPAMHDASTDTSPENDNSRYDAAGADGKDEDIPTPPELRHSAEEVAETARHDRILQGQIEASRAQIMRESPREPDTETSDGTGIQEAEDTEMGGVVTNTEQCRPEDPAKDVNEAIDEVMDDQQESLTTSQTAISIPEVPARPHSNATAEIADSEAEATPPAEAMDVDSGTVKDSFESSSTAKELPAPAAVPEAVEPLTQPDIESSRDSTAPAVPTLQQTPSSPQVMEGSTTRIRSGAIKRTHVSEIVGEAPKLNSTAASDRNSSSRSTTPQSPGARRSLLEKTKENSRSKLSTVIFPKQAPKGPSQDPARIQDGMPPPTDDYFIPLFLATSGTEKRGGPTLDNLLATAHKTITTANAYVPIHENQTAKILKRIYNLQVSNKWSLRQPKRSEEVVRPTTHWDVLLQEAKWMRTDFREERKWKTTVARNLAYACAEWVECDAEDRKLLQVKATPPPPQPKDGLKDIDMGDNSSQAGAHPTPDLVASADSPMDDLDEEPRLNLLETVSPTAIFGLQDDDVIFGLRRSPTTDKLLNELPIYGAPLVVPKSDLPTSEIDPDRFWKRPALPLSKFVEGRLELKLDPPPRKRSRYEYGLEDDDEDHVVFGEQRAKAPMLPPENSDVALFDPHHKHIRDRIHSSHQFRPPSEFQMPSQSFYENRSMSQWTWDEDNELKNLVREYSYNWGLISSMLTSKSLFSSGAERRTPWECFERWVQTEGMPADMGRTHYFRMYTNRIDQANRNVLAQQPPAPQQPHASGQVQPPPRRRPTSSIRVDRRRNQKHLTIVDAMRKLAKKRETNLQKQQHAAGMAAMRKANEAPHPVNRQMPATTPQDFSRLKHEREEQFKERVAQMQQRQEQQRRVSTTAHLCCVPS
jgi:chromatin modification-related protein VID21